MSRLDKANRILWDITCIILILIAPVFVLKILGFERMISDEWSNSLY